VFAHINSVAVKLISHPVNKDMKSQLLSPSHLWFLHIHLTSSFLCQSMALQKLFVGTLRSGWTCRYSFCSKVSYSYLVHYFLQNLTPSKDLNYNT